MSSLAQKIADAMMLEDGFSNWLGLRIISIIPGHCQIQMQITPAMLNGFGIAHGGIVFSVCDSACSFAVNAHGRRSMSVESSISQFKAVQPGDVLNCYVKEESLGKKLGVYSAEIINQDEMKIAIFKGTYYRSDKKWFEENTDPDSATGSPSV